MIDHEYIDRYGFDEIPLNTDIYLMDAVWMEEYKRFIIETLNGHSWRSVGYISHASVRSIGSDSAELSWFPNIHSRYHEIRINIPRAAFVACLGCWKIDADPTIFLNGDWLRDIFDRTYSAFALVDAVGVKKALENSAIDGKKLGILRGEIDRISKYYDDFAFISLTDSLIIKTNWTIGRFDNDISYNYNPEKIIKILPEVRSAFKSALDLETYSIVTQGRNEFYGNELIHVSESKNHLSLNSLGIPFAQLIAIENAARSNIRSSIHPPQEVYLDKDFFLSLNWRNYEERQTVPRFAYPAPMTTHPCSYVGVNMTTLLAQIEFEN